jgi:aminoglycoside phosphotransferase (APT) family kinase protein
MELADLSGRIEIFLRAETGDRDLQVRDVVPLTGGYSLFTVRFTAVSSAGEATYVLRADPPGDAALTHTDRRREWELLQALTSLRNAPMPDAKWADPDGSHFGTPAILLDFVDGPQLLAHLQGADHATQCALALQLASTIGNVHRLGAQVVPDSFERPTSWDEYIDGFIEGWRDVEANHVERNPFIRWVAKWLDTHRPPPAPLTLVHGEFQTGNVMLDSSGAMQVIDWEYSHIGDPRVDLGWIQNVGAFSPPDPIAADPMGFCARYCEVTGLSEELVNPLTVGWFSILGGYKALGGLLGGIAAMANGQNHLITSAYLVSAMPFTHRMWRQGVAELEAAMASTEQQMEALS